METNRNIKDGRQDRCDEHDKVNRKNRDRMILVDGVEIWEGEVKEWTNYENKSNFRFKGDHKGNIILIGSVKKEKLVKGKVGNTVRIATKTMSLSNNKIIRIKHL